MWYNGTDGTKMRVGYAVSPKGFWCTPIRNSDFSVADTETIKVHIDVPDPRLSFLASIDSAHGGRKDLDSLQLYDDGLHGDSLAGDGLYGNIWHAPYAGAYLVGISLTLNDTVRFNETENLTNFTVPVAENQTAVPSSFALEQNYPNPFNPLTQIKYSVGGVRGQGPGVSKIRLVVYDLLGREVAVLVNERKAPGNYEVTFDASGLSSGVYVYRLSAGTFMQTRTMLLIK